MGARRGSPWRLEDEFVMMEAWAGLATGLIHVISGPDHLAAVAPLAVEGKRKTWRVGLLWGIGHTSGVWLVAALAFGLRERYPLAMLSAGAERLVGVALIAIGLWSFHRSLAKREPSSHVHRHASFGVGILHGWAGSSHFLGILPALAIPSREGVLSYLIAFGLGSIAAMGGFSWLLGSLGARAPGPRPRRWLTWSCSAAAVVIGGFWLTAPP